MKSLGLVPEDPGADICDEDAPVWDLMKNGLM
jgi:hypothetical protein